MEARSKHKILPVIIMLIAAISAAFTVAACQPAAKDQKTADVKADYVITKVKGDINWVFNCSTKFVFCSKVK